MLFEQSNPWIQSPFPTLFECASAFGTVGLSLGFGSSNASLSGAYSIPSKLVIMVLMVFGCHRSLPESVDSAVQMKQVPVSHVVAMVSLPGREPFVARAELKAMWKRMSNNLEKE